MADFVTTERDVKKGQTRKPFEIARLHEEDLMSDEEVKAASMKKV